MIPQGAPPKRILFFNTEAEMYGGERCLLDVVERMGPGWEPRFVLLFDSKDPITGQSAYTFTPDLNLLFAKDQRKGMYWTVGAGIDLLHAAGSSATQIGFNGGIGQRKPYESGAIRMEAFLQYKLKNTSKGLPNELNIGARVGLSLWH